MTWIIKVTHIDKNEKQLACQHVITDDIVDFTFIDVRVEVFKKMLTQIDAQRKEKNV